MGSEIRRVRAEGPLLEAIEKAAGLEVPEIILRHQPLGGPRGAKVIVVSRRPLERTPSGVIIPQSSQVKERDGWILSISMDCGAVLTQAFEDEVSPIEDMIGLHVAWGRHTGTQLAVSDMDDPLDGRFLLLVEQDILTCLGKVPV